MLRYRCICFFFSSRRRHTRCREVSWARRCVQETGTGGFSEILKCSNKNNNKTYAMKIIRTSKMTDVKIALLLMGEIEIMLDLYKSPFTIKLHDYFAVSYTHLTLPTILLVQISVVAVSLNKKKITLHVQYSQCKTKNQKQNM
eukprot:TRINITY_DN47400_c0_g1_i1.p1 TRINITY_DN47400_c0_g1~~TRINITY_DN47400_c0_g1_i1.p1  ORF type:complete len:143 (+),score=41.98 TRINITY_DN47400_c0_g1_i1:82-510(+)